MTGVRAEAAHLPLTITLFRTSNQGLIQPAPLVTTHPEFLLYGQVATIRLCVTLAQGIFVDDSLVDQVVGAWIGVCGR